MSAARTLAMRRPVPRPSRVRSRPSASRRRLAQRADALAYARGVLDAEAAAILGAKERLGASFIRALELMRACEGHVVVTGLGKPGFIAQKLSATLASTGVPSLYLHPSEALHGDLGRVSRGDVVLALSNSGSTEELVRLLPSLRRLGAQVVAITGDGDSPLARGADVVLDVGAIPEACPLGLVPTASSAALHAVSDALAMTLLKTRQFSSEEYAALHPGGKLGRSVMRVLEVMRAGRANPVVRADAPLHEAVVVMTNTPGRPGATNVVDAAGPAGGHLHRRRPAADGRAGEDRLRPPGLGGDGPPPPLRVARGPGAHRRGADARGPRRSAPGGGRRGPPGRASSTCRTCSPPG